ncbi:MAG: helix-turn-helix transcriptional regulator [Candidatus Methylacidiphilales bacterium]|nr:helix-turn-helix transcriptional regulator [Candidatus Methylacidiphilales bacterium]
MLSARRGVVSSREVWETDGVPEDLHFSLLIDTGAGLKFSHAGQTLRAAREGLFMVRDHGVKVVCEPVGPPFPRFLTVSVRCQPPRAATSLAGGGMLELDAPGRQRVQALMEWILDLMRIRNPTDAKMARRVAGLLLDFLLCGEASAGLLGRPSPPPLPPVITRALMLMHAHVDRTGGRSNNLQHLAQRAGVSPRTLRRIFLQTLGLRPRDCLGRIRVRQAAQMIRDSARSLADIAATTGFSDQGHLARHFRSAYGMSPAAFRANPAIAIDRMPIPGLTALEPNTFVQFGIRDVDLSGSTTAAEMEKGLMQLLKKQQGPRVTGQWTPLEPGRARRACLRTPNRCWLKSGLLWENLRSGRLDFFGVPFWLPEETPERPSAVVFPSNSAPDEVSVDGVDIDLKGKKYTRLALLHACAYAGLGSGPVARIGLHPANGGRVSFAIHLASEGTQASPTRSRPEDPLLSDWWPLYLGQANASSKPVLIVNPDSPLFNIRRAFLWEWQNPQPNVPLKKMTLRPCGISGACYVLLALSGQVATV